MGQRAKVASDIAQLTLLDDLVAIPPTLGPAKIARTGSVTSGSGQAIGGVNPAEFEAFKNAGWLLVPTGSAPDGEQRRVYRGPDGRLMIDSGQVSVRFAPETPDDVVHDILNEHGLAVGRAHGFAPKLFNARKRDSNSEDFSSVAAATELAAHAEVEYAEPVMIESLPGRGHR